MKMRDGADSASGRVMAARIGSCGNGDHVQVRRNLLGQDFDLGVVDSLPHTFVDAATAAINIRKRILFFSWRLFLKFRVERIHIGNARRPAKIIGLDPRHQLFLGRTIPYRLFRATDKRFDFGLVSLHIGLSQNTAITRNTRVEINFRMLSSTLGHSRKLPPPA